MKLQPLDLYQNYYYYDQGVLPNEQRFVPFALSDAFTLNVGEHRRPYLHFWQLPNTVILGMKDSRLRISSCLELFTRRKLSRHVP